MPPHLFACWEKVSRRIRNARILWIFLDFDGTLVPFCEQPDAVMVSPQCRRILERLGAERRVHITIVSGRRNAALRAHVGMARIKLLGLFGWENGHRPVLPRETKALLSGLEGSLTELAGRFPGVRVEDKGVAYSVHFRGATLETRRAVRARIRGFLGRLQPAFHGIASENACDIVPRQVRGKGAAVAEFKRRLPPSSLPIYVGDDLTDEPAFEALRRGITVRVGSPRKTSARFRLRDPQEVCTFLERIQDEIA